MCLWRQDSSLVAVVDSAEPGGTGFESRCDLNLSFVHIYAVTQTVQIRGIIMPTERITDPPIKNVQKKEWLICQKWHVNGQWNLYFGWKMALTNKWNNKLLLTTSDTTLLLLVRFLEYLLNDIFKINKYLKSFF